MKGINRAPYFPHTGETFNDNKVKTDLTASPYAPKFMLMLLRLQKGGLQRAILGTAPGGGDCEHDALGCTRLVLLDLGEQSGEVLHEVAPELEKLAAWRESHGFGDPDEERRSPNMKKTQTQSENG